MKLWQVQKERTYIWCFEMSRIQMTPTNTTKATHTHHTNSLSVIKMHTEGPVGSNTVI